MSDSTLVVIPVKLDEAKSRLSSVFSVEERRELVFTMLTDVTEAFTKSKDDIMLCFLSRDRRIEDYASENDYGFIKEIHPGLNASIIDAVNWASRRLSLDQSLSHSSLKDAGY